MQNFYKSVLLHESIELLNVRPGEKYIDATIGGGGHTGKILQRGGKVLGIDVDQDALDFVKEKFKIGEDLILVRGNFKDIGRSGGGNSLLPVLVALSKAFFAFFCQYGKGWGILGNSFQKF